MTDATGGPRVVTLGESDLDEVVDVLCDAFVDYPVMRYVLQASGERHDMELRTLIGFFSGARALRGETMFGVPEEGRLAGVALTSFPENRASPEALDRLRAEVWETLGPGARARYEAFGTATRPFFGGLRRVHLNMIGVRRAQQGRGLARPLLEAVHAMSPERPGSTGTTLTTENPENVRLYERFGYRVVARARVAPELETWGMYREDPE
jgi:hypothetical protein